MFYRKNDSLFFKGDVSNDTIRRLSGIHSEPYMFINMGKYKLPFEFERWVSDEAYQKNRHRCWSVASLVEDNRYFFLMSHTRKYIRKEKRYAEFKFMVYDKIERKGFCTKDNNNIGMTDDILGGPPFYPRWISNDINTIEALKLLETVDAEGYTPSSPLKELLSRINEDSNDIIILCHKKNSND